MRGVPNNLVPLRCPMSGGVEIMAVPKIHPMRVRNPKQALLALRSSPDPPHSSCTLGGQVICLVAVKELNLSFDNVRGFRA